MTDYHPRSGRRSGCCWLEGDGLAISNYERFALMRQVFPRGYTMTDISMMIKKMLEVNDDLNRIMNIRSDL